MKYVNILVKNLITIAKGLAVVIVLWNVVPWLKSWGTVKMIEYKQESFERNQLEKSLKITPLELNRVVGVIACGWAAGSGVEIAPGVFLTNAHVVGWCEEVMVYTDRTGQFNPVRVLAVNEDKDLALIGVETGLVIPDIVIRSPASQERVFAVGFPGANSMFKSAGNVVKDVVIGGRKVNMHSGFTTQGMSGGPVLSEAGELIGLTFAGYKRKTMEHIVSDMEPGMMKKWLDMINIHRSAMVPAVEIREFIILYNLSLLKNPSVQTEGYNDEDN